MVIGNLAGHDGKDVLVNYFAKKPGRGLIWFEHLDQAPWFKEHALGPENVGVSHGSGIGDINGDGRDDVVTTSGWFESPPQPTEEPVDLASRLPVYALRRRQGPAGRDCRC